MQTVLIIGFVWPEPKSSAAGSRMLQLIDVFHSRGDRITFASPSQKGAQAADLKRLSIDEQTIVLNDDSFDAFISALNPNIVIFDRFMMEEQFGWRVTEHCPNALKILDTEDLHCLRKGRQQAYKTNVPFNETFLFNDTAKREIASIFRCDLSLMISEYEIELLKDKFQVPDYLLGYLPFMLDPVTDEEQSQVIPFEERKHFVTIGNFLHEPNYQTTLYLKRVIWPLIKKELPQAELHIYGAYASQKVNQLHQPKDHFFIKGFAADTNVMLQQARVCLAPLVFGAGLKGKLVDAMKNGTPCAMSSIAAEGMFGDFKPNGCITDQPATFAKSASELYSSKELWRESQQAGFLAYNKRFDKKYFHKKVLGQIDLIQSTLQSHRFRNFIGLMLQHHTMQSTKFMSRWIQEKNNHLSR